MGKNKDPGFFNCKQSTQLVQARDVAQEHGNGPAELGVDRNHLDGSTAILLIKNICSFTV